jgi:hypothetical protein
MDNGKVAPAPLIGGSSILKEQGADNESNSTHSNKKLF